MLNAVYSLARSDTVCIVGLGVVVKGLKLTSLLPSQSMAEILNRVALSIVLNIISVIGLKKITPSSIVEIFLTVLRDDITVVIILHTVYDRAVNSFGKKLAESIVGVLGNVDNRLVISSLVRLGYRGDSFLGIILIGESSAIREENLAYKLSCGRGITFT